MSAQYDVENLAIAAGCASSHVITAFVRNNAAAAVIATEPLGDSSANAPTGRPSTAQAGIQCFPRTPT
jgi:hypothetical protein